MTDTAGMTPDTSLKAGMRPDASELKLGMRPDAPVLKSGMRPDKPGGLDGLKVDVQGNLFATGPGGVWVITPDGTHLGTIETAAKTANVGWGDDGTVLYITADKTLYRLRTATKGKLP